MLDELFGRASLKERIDDLEDENERLRKRYEAESDRRAEAATARQDAEERINRLEDRIAQLEGELDRVNERDAGLDVRRRDRLRGDRLETILDRLASFQTSPEGALTVSVRDDGLSEPVRTQLADVLGDRVALVDDATPCLCCIDDAGLIALTLEPPVDTELAATWDDRFVLEREWFLPTGRHALALVRTDLFALGVFEGDERVDYQGFESDVKGNHSKGGFSQARFERIRDEQVDDHLERCRATLAAYERGGELTAVPLYLVGQRGVVDALVAESQLEPAATAAVDATGAPKPALEDAVRSFWTTEVQIL
ncbi:Vms1/Ankzf1 family peptidyl-tRNA hydrolase [Natrinema gelatinilyticum]|uniref:Vms1/Ankzf1 family peptidyl-tRNA hydrolase n=1 Tax=Natrinema gelatinilyticum TaxID=2961571 RepID=UPI0020C3777F|nr:Vms1/Ankzf1 family peptidyl-tRNA hydrolase [Natrinema gelatinilyticum]